MWREWATIFPYVQAVRKMKEFWGGSNVIISGSDVSLVISGSAAELNWSYALVDEGQVSSRDLTIPWSASHP
jgi:hypothetical protein